MPAKPTSQRQKQLAKMRQRRTALDQRREDILDDILRGLDYVVVAGRNKISVRTVRREVDRALDKRWLEPPQRYLRIQVARLNRAVRMIDDAIGDNEIAAVDPLIKLLDKLDRYHGLAQQRPELQAHDPAPRRLAAPADKPLSLTHAGTKIET